MRRVGSIVLPAICLAMLAGATERSARAYDFEIASRSSAEAYRVRWFRFSEADRLLDRRRFVQTLGLEVWNLLEPPGEDRAGDGELLAPFQLGVSAEMRFAHDFGDYVRGDITYPVGSSMTARDSATNVVPELRDDDQHLELLYGYVY